MERERITTGRSLVLRPDPSSIEEELTNLDVVVVTPPDADDPDDEYVEVRLHLWVRVDELHDPLADNDTDLT